MTAADIQSGQLVNHYKGTTYSIVGVALDDEEVEQVVYTDVNTQKLYTQSLERFLGTLPAGGGIGVGLPRFSKVASKPLYGDMPKQFLVPKPNGFGFNDIPFDRWRKHIADVEQRLIARIASVMQERGMLVTERSINDAAKQGLVKIYKAHHLPDGYKPLTYFLKFSLSDPNPTLLLLDKGPGE